MVFSIIDSQVKQFQKCQCNYLPGVCLSRCGYKLCEGGDSCSSTQSQCLARCWIDLGEALAFRNLLVYKGHHLGGIMRPSLKTIPSAPKVETTTPSAPKVETTIPSAPKVLSENVQEQTNFWTSHPHMLTHLPRLCCCGCVGPVTVCRAVRPFINLLIHLTDLFSLLRLRIVLVFVERKRVSWGSSPLSKWQGY